MRTLCTIGYSSILDLVLGSTTRGRQLNYLFTVVIIIIIIN